MTDPPLDDEQRLVVMSPDSAIAVMAGSGSGETPVLSYRTRYLLSQSPTTRALLLTFTNNAAGEMKSRALGVTAVASERIFASTFHTFCLNVLRYHGALVGLDPDFVVLDNDEQNDGAQRAALAAGVPNAKEAWSYARLRRESPEARMVERFGACFQTLKRDEGSVDFDDLIVHVAELFESTPELASVYSERYPHLLVDEFQDTNAAQFSIVRALARGTKTVSVFADDDQAIYQFAGAEYENVLEFARSLGATQYHLTTNYRCHEIIATHANRLILADPAASGRTMRAAYSGGSVRSLVFDNVYDEADALVSEIQSKVTVEGIDPDDIAVLSRSRSRLQRFVVALERSHVSFSNWLDPTLRDDQRALMRTCFSVVRGSLNDRQAWKLFEFLGCQESGERDPVRILEANGDRVGAAELIQLREAVWSGVATVELMNLAAQACIAIDPSVRSTVQSVVERVEQLLRFDRDFGIDHLLSELALGTGLQPVAQVGIKVATLHRTKGLQWRCVYLVGLENGTLPSYWAKTGAARREERRACFVGVSRAQVDLTLSRVMYLNGFPKAQSVFLTDMLGE